MSKVKLSTFYTNCVVGGNYIQYRGIENGKRIAKRIPYSPTLFVPSNKQSKFKTLFGQSVEPIKQGSIKDARNFIERYKGVENFKIYGNTYYHYCYLLEKFPDTVEYDINDIWIANIDIETDNDVDSENARSAIISIAIKMNGKFDVFGYGDYKPHQDNITYHKAPDEIEMLKKFMNFWVANYPDVISGWNVGGFDVPYIYNRLLRLFGEDFAKQLSPWGWITKRTVILMGRQHEMIGISGISILDYLELYKKHAPERNRESYKLDYIAHVELGERKLDYGEYGSLKKLHKENYQKYTEYNIQDVNLVDKLNNKLKLLEMVFASAYDARVNYDDILGQIRTWDNLIFKELLKRNVVVPQREDGDKEASYEGAHVKEPIPGLHRWVASLDINSLYPSIIQMFNMSPETITDNVKSVSVESLLSKEQEFADLKEKNYTMTANGCIFKCDKLGILPELVHRMYQERKEFKKKKIEAEEELEKVKAELDRRGIKYES